MDRLARNLDDLRQIVQKLNKQNIKIQFIKENLIFTGEDSPMSQLLLSVMGAFAEFERSLIRERQKEGIAIAKAKGLFKGRKACLDSTQIAYLNEQAKLGVPKSKIARDLNVSRPTIYQYLNSLI